jgi:hypothetical protein
VKIAFIKDGLYKGKNMMKKKDSIAVVLVGFGRQ